MSSRAWGWWLATTGVVVIAAALVDPVAGGVVWLGMVVSGALALRGVGAEFDALQRLVSSLRTLPAEAHEELPTDLPGDAGELSRVLREAARRRAEAQEAAEREWRRAEQIFEITPTGVVIVGRDGRIVGANPAVHDLVSPRRDPVGFLPIEVIPCAEIHEAVSDVLAGRQAPTRHAVSGEHDVSIDALAMGDEVLVLIRDVTRFRRAERARTDFVANVSHELRTPIAAIRGFAEALQLDAEELPETARPMIAAILRNSDRLSSLFQDLLTLYHIETRRRRLPTSEFALRPVLQEAVVPAVDRASTKDIEFALECAADLTVVANRQALSAIVGNLAGNACKYTPDQGRITVRAFVDDEDRVVIEVEDTGVGIPAAHLKRIFERFYRVDEGRSSAVPGTGIGLAIVKHLSIALGCEVDVRSEEGRGSVFSVRLPAPHREDALPRTWDATLPAPPEDAADSGADRHEGVTAPR